MCLSLLGANFSFPDNISVLHYKITKTSKQKKPKTSIPILLFLKRNDSNQKSRFIISCLIAKG